MASWCFGILAFMGLVSGRRWTWWGSFPVILTMAELRDSKMDFCCLYRISLIFRLCLAWVRSSFSAAPRRCCLWVIATCSWDFSTCFL